jgi:hypothetical protein
MTKSIGGIRVSIVSILEVHPRLILDRPRHGGNQVLRDKQDENTYCLTGECSRKLMCCLTKRAPVASRSSCRAAASFLITKINPY